MSEIREDAHGHLTCSEHGETVVQSYGTWTGRPMAECSECGAYLLNGQEGVKS